MDLDTPLHEVALHLGRAAALMLSQQPHHVQARVLGQLRLAIHWWEGKGIQLDPIEYEVVVDSFVASTVALHQVLEEECRG